MSGNIKEILNQRKFWQNNHIHFLLYFLNKLKVAHYYPQIECYRDIGNSYLLCMCEFWINKSRRCDDFLKS